MPQIAIDLFSDSNCQPSESMRQVMARAEVGNEAAGEDPTVNQLIERVCHLLGKESGVFLPSGTMCNGIAYRVWCQRPGDKIIMDAKAHAHIKTAGLLGGLVNATVQSIVCERGIFDSLQIQDAVTEYEGYNVPRPRLISLEQTTNYGGGAVWPLESLADVTSYAKLHNVAVHMDGARLFNASIVSGLSANTYTQYTDSVWIDFSKGLGAPVGTVLCGSKEFIDEAWYYKFQQGGAMHQAGILAAGCLYALDNHIDRLAIDHEHAKLLANKLAIYPQITIDLNQIETNIVIFKLINTSITAFQLAEALLEKGIRLFAVDKQTLRAITHMDITKMDIVRVSDSIGIILQNHSL